MNLRTYLDTLPRGGIADFARKVGISPIYLQQLAARQNDREPSPSLCARIVKESGNNVLLWDCRPHDWHCIWPMLIGQPGAPAIPQEDPSVARSALRALAAAHDSEHPRVGGRESKARA